MKSIVPLITISLLALSLNAISVSWELMEPKGISPSNRTGHALNTAFSAGVFMFAGETEHGYSNDLYLLSFYHGVSWDTVDVKGTKPEGRAYSCLVYTRHGMLVYGGVGENDTVLGDLWIFEFQGDVPVWKALDASEGPGPRAYAGIRELNDSEENDQMVLVGGMDEEGKMHNDVWVYDCGRMQWKRIVADHSEMPALSRFGIASLLNEDDAVTVYVFGGLSSSGKNSNDIWALDVVKSKWRKITYSSKAPQGREHMIFTALTESLFVVYGGYNRNINTYLDDFWLFNIDDQSWEQMNLVGSPVSPRIPIAIAIDANLLQFGGQSESGLLGTLYSTNFE